jgi:hypothetical protein
MSLSDILNGKIHQLEVAEKPNLVPEGFCVECEDQQASVQCLTCPDLFCQVCFTYQHRKGTRATHKFTVLFTHSAAPTESILVDAAEVADLDVVYQTDGNILERSKYIPLRLTLDERKFLRLLDAALTVSEYTDKIDVIIYNNKNKRIVHQIKELCSILSGLVLAADYSIGQELFQEKDFAANQAFFQDIFELGRRHKIMNPEKMRATYGKLIYMLQDSQMDQVKELLNFDCVKPIKTVHAVLQAANALAVLDDERIHVAVMEITPDSKSRSQIQSEIKAKEKAISYLSQRYANQNIKPEAIAQCLYSIGDNNSFLR